MRHRNKARRERGCRASSNQVIPRKGSASKAMAARQRKQVDLKGSWVAHSRVAFVQLHLVLGLHACAHPAARAVNGKPCEQLLGQEHWRATSTQ